MQSATMKRLALSLLLVLPVLAENPDMARLRGDWQRARERAIEPVDRKYLDALKALKERFVREKKLEDAVLVEREMSKVAGADGGWFKSKVTEEVLTMGEWRFDMKEPRPYSAHVILKKSGDLVDATSKERIGKWTVKGGNVLRFDLMHSWNEFDLEYEGASPVLIESRFDGGTRKGTTLTQIVK